MNAWLPRRACRSDSVDMLKVLVEAGVAAAFAAIGTRFEEINWRRCRRLSQPSSAGADLAPVLSTSEPFAAPLPSGAVSARAGWRVYASHDFSRTPGRAKMIRRDKISNTLIPSDFAAKRSRLRGFGSAHRDGARHGVALGVGAFIVLDCWRPTPCVEELPVEATACLLALTSYGGCKAFRGAPRRRDAPRPETGEHRARSRQVRCPSSRDFGLAKTRRANAVSEGASRSPKRLRNPPTLSPEQCNGEIVDPARKF